MYVKNSVMLWLLFFLCTIMSVFANEKERLPCDVTIVCTKNDTLQWKQLKKDYDYLRSNLNDTKKAEALRHANSFCTNEYLGYLLFEESLNWPLACVWTKSNKGGCYPAPNGDHPYDYIPRDEWRILLTNVRKAIGCSEISISSAEEVSELHVCRDRCTELGFSTITYIIFDISIFALLAIIGMHEF